MSRALPSQAPPRRDFLALLEASRESIASLLPNPDKVGRVLRIARTAYQLNADLQKCRPESILAAVMKASELNLEPGGALGHAYLIGYGGECQFQVSYKGMLELARRSGQFRAIEARLVHQADQFQLAYTPEPVFDHRPHLGDDRGPETHAYAYARMNNGALVFEIMSRAEVEHVRQSSKCGPVWRHHWGEMAKKTVIKRMLKRQSVSIELAEAIEHDNSDYTPDAPATATATVHTSRTAALAARLGVPRIEHAPEADGPHEEPGEPEEWPLPTEDDYQGEMP